MVSVNETVLGSLKSLGVPQNACYEDFTQLLKDLPNWLTVEVPASVGNVVISVTEPGEDDKGKVWIRISGTGNFVAPYMFFNGSWKRIYDYAPGSIIWMSGNSSQVGVAGTDLEPFELITPTAPSSVPSNARSAIVAQYVAASPVTSPVQYIYFAVLYVGY